MCTYVLIIVRASLGEVISSVIGGAVPQKTKHHISLGSKRDQKKAEAIKNEWLEDDQMDDIRSQVGKENMFGRELGKRRHNLSYY